MVRQSKTSGGDGIRTCDIAPRRVWQRPLPGSSVPKTLPAIKAISTMCDRAVILAGGMGTRLRPYTVVLPKPLMPIGPYPILEVGGASTGAPRIPAGYHGG